MFSNKARNFIRYVNNSTRFIFDRKSTSRIGFSSLNSTSRSLRSFDAHPDKKINKIFSGLLMITGSTIGTFVYLMWYGKVVGKDQDTNCSVEQSVISAEKDYGPVIVKCRDILQRLKDEVGAPGLVVGVSVDGETAWEEGFGYADIENRVPCSPSTVMRIASVSKSITMAAVAKLWEEGKLNIDKPIQHYLPDFPRKTFNGVPVEITCRHLVSHLAGIRHYTKNMKSNSKGDPISMDATKQDKNPNIQGKKEAGNSKVEKELELKEIYSRDKYSDVKSALKLFKDDALVAEPGSKFYYSTHGWTLISALVEKTAKEPFTTHITKLFKKLGMQNTYLDVNDSLIYHRSRYYMKNKYGCLINAPYVDNSYKWAGGGFLSTVGDLLKFANAMLYSLQFQPTASSLDKDCSSAREREERNIPTTTTSIDTKDEVSEKKLFDTSELSDSSASHSTNNAVSDRKLHGYLTSQTVKLVWSPVADAKDRNSMYGMGWFVYPEKQDCEYCAYQRFSVLHTGGAVGASSVLLILPKQCSVQSSLQCQWRSPPKGIVVTIMTNLQNISLSTAALEIAKLFDSYSYNHSSHNM